MLVSNLWSIRNFWEWLAPGIGDNRDRALASAAFVTYENLSSYRDFLLQFERPGKEQGLRSSGSVSSGGSVGLWAKQFMTDGEYKYMGTLTNQTMFDETVKNVPPVCTLTESSQKTRWEQAVRKVFARLQKGPLRDQFSPARLADVAPLVLV